MISFVFDILMWWELEAVAWVVTDVLVPKRRWNDGLILKCIFYFSNLIKKNIRLRFLSEAHWHDSRVFIRINSRIRHFAQTVITSAGSVVDHGGGGVGIGTFNPWVGPRLTPRQLCHFLQITKTIVNDHLGDYAYSLLRRCQLCWTWLTGDNRHVAWAMNRRVTGRHCLSPLARLVLFKSGLVRALFTLLFNFCLYIVLT